MTISEIASQLRMVLGVCVKADAKISPAQGVYFDAVQDDCSDEEIISLWLSVSSLEERQVPMFVAKHWAKRACNFIEWIAAVGAQHRSTRKQLKRHAGPRTDRFDHAIGAGTTEPRGARRLRCLLGCRRATSGNQLFLTPCVYVNFR
jgi:hypothetical protein